MIFQNFVGIFENAYSEEFCNKCIEYYEYMISCGLGETRQQSEQTPRFYKDDVQIFVPPLTKDNKEHFIPLKRYIKEFTDDFWSKYYPLYADKVTVLDAIPEHGVFSCKLQKTEIGGGYHGWHIESDNTTQRILAWALYLNDVEAGGETEFLYQHMRVHPSAGTLVIWPAGITHPHRGNPPISNVKYILTGWVEYK